MFNYALKIDYFRGEKNVTLAEFMHKEDAMSCLENRAYTNFRDATWIIDLNEQREGLENVTNK